MYFSKFKKGGYDINGDGIRKLATDLFTRVKMREKIIDEASLYDKYDVPPGERPEVTAFKHFGDTELHWVILLTNNITDVYYGWPLSFQDFETFVKNKYANPDGVHHYELTQSSGPQSGFGPNDYSHKIEVNSTTTGAQSVSNREYEEREQDKKRSIRLLNQKFLPAFIEEFDNLIKE